MKIKRIMLALAALIMIIVISGCATATYVPYCASVSFPAEKDYKILGRVDYVGVVGIASYHKLLDVAKEKYPQCDDVVNIIVDAKRSQSWTGRVDSFMMSGIAIEYTK